MTKEKKNSKIKILIIILSVLLTISVAALIVINVRNSAAKNEPVIAEVTDNIITPESDNQDITNSESEKNTAYTNAISTNEDTDLTESVSYYEKAVELSLYNRQPGVNTPFKATNLYPGDSVEKSYEIKVSHKSKVTVKYHADIKSGGDALGNVLMIKIAVGKNDVIYDGPIAKMPKYLETAISGNGVHVLDYHMTAYLDTSVGNEYQNKELLADFRWWVDEAENLGPSPDTGAVENMLVWAVLATAVGICILMILLYRRKGEKE